MGTPGTWSCTIRGVVSRLSRGCRTYCPVRICAKLQIDRYAGVPKLTSPAVTSGHLADKPDPLCLWNVDYVVSIIICFPETSKSSRCRCYVFGICLLLFCKRQCSYGILLEHSEHSVLIFLGGFFLHWLIRWNVMHSILDKSASYNKGCHFSRNQILYSFY